MPPLQSRSPASHAERVVTVTSVPNLPMIRPGDDLALCLISACDAGGLLPEDGDIWVIAQKVVSKAEGRYIDLAHIEPSKQARELSVEVDKDPRLVEVILAESRRVVRHRRGVLIVEHRLGFVTANAGIDQSNVDPAAGIEPVLLLPSDPDASAARLLDTLATRFGKRFGVVIADSFGRPWRRGTVGVAIGAAGIPALVDMRGRPDLFGRALRTTETGFADEVAATATLLMGQSNEARPVALVRGAAWSGSSSGSRSLVRPPEEDLFR